MVGFTKALLVCISIASSPPSTIYKYDYCDMDIKSIPMPLPTEQEDSKLINNRRQLSKNLTLIKNTFFNSDLVGHTCETCVTDGMLIIDTKFSETQVDPLPKKK